MGNIEKFDLVAGQYDTPERVRVTNIIADAIRPRIENGAQKSAIDFGCGTGLVGLKLLEDFRSVLFLDASANMVEVVRQKLRRARIPNAEVLCCDFEEDSPSDIQADYILMAQVLLHIRDIEPLLARLYAALREGGHLLIVDFDKNEAVVSSEVHNGFVQDDLMSLLKRLGFAAVCSETFYHGENLFMGQDASLFLMDAVK